MCTLLGHREEQLLEWEKAEAFLELPPQRTACKKSICMCNKCIDGIHETLKILSFSETDRFLVTKLGERRELVELSRSVYCFIPCSLCLSCLPAGEVADIWAGNIHVFPMFKVVGCFSMFLGSHLCPFSRRFWIIFWWGMLRWSSLSSNAVLKFLHTLFFLIFSRLIFSFLSFYH